MFAAMRLVVFILIILSPAPVYAQEYWDLKYHEGGDAAKFNNDPGFQGNLHRDPRLRNRENVETRTPATKATSRESKRLLERLDVEKKQAINFLDSLLKVRDGKLLICNYCPGTGILPCGTCLGSGTTECSACHGAPGLTCRSCNGSGLVNEQQCPACEGNGKKVCQFCHGKVLPCEVCKGIGFDNCTRCQGSGNMIWVESTGDTVRVGDHHARHQTAGSGKRGKSK